MKITRMDTDRDINKKVSCINLVTKAGDEYIISEEFGALVILHQNEQDKDLYVKPSCSNVIKLIGK